MSQTKAQLLDNIKDNVQLDARNALRFADTDSSHYVAFKAPATVSSNVTWTLPAADGSANYVLATDGSGTLSWIADPAGQWVTSGSNIYFTGGNVGIGDSSPSNPLSVTGASAFNGDVQFTGDAANVTWDKSDDDLKFGDSAKAVFGLGSDLAIWSGGAATYIQTQHTGGTIYLGTTSADNLMNITSSGVTFLGETFWTNGNDIKLNDSSKILVGTSSDIQIYHDASDSYITNATGNLFIRGNGSNNIRLQAKSGEDGVLIKPDGAIELYYDNSLKLSTYSSGVSLEDHLWLKDSKELRVGDGSDLKIYHDGSNSRIKNSTGSLWLQSDTGIRFTDEGVNESMAAFYDNGACELYYDGSKKFETTAGGAIITGTLDTTGTITGGGHIKTGSDSGYFFAGASNDLTIKHDGTHSFVETSTGNLYLKSTADDVVVTAADDFIVLLANNESGIRSKSGGETELYHNNTKKFETTSDGVLVTGRLTTNSDYNYLQGYSDSTSTLTLKKSNSQANSIDYLQCRDSNNTLYHTIQGGGHIKLQDNVNIKIGDSDDLKLWHSGSHSYIQDVGTGNLAIGADDLHLMNSATTEYYIKCTTNGGVELYYDNDKICYTANTCLAFPDSRKLFFGAGNDLQIFHDGTHNYIQNAVAGQDLYLSTKRDLHLQMGDNSGGYHDCFYADNNGSVRLYHDANEKFKTTSDGVIVNGGIYLDGSGGGAAANKLDDYEEGSWTPDPHDGTCTATNPKYRKVGSLVECWAFLSSFSDTSTNDQIKITGLPFTPAHAHVAGNAMCSYSNDVSCVHAYVSTMGHVHFYGNNSGSYSQYRHNEINNASAQIYLHVAYYI